MNHSYLLSVFIVSHSSIEWTMECSDFLALPLLLERQPRRNLRYFNVLLVAMEFRSSSRLRWLIFDWSATRSQSSGSWPLIREVTRPMARSSLLWSFPTRPSRSLCLLCILSNTHPSHPSTSSIRRRYGQLRPSTKMPVSPPSTSLPGMS